jgi:hypothetical protein
MRVPKLWSAGRSLTPPPLPNRARKFPCTRLFSRKATVIDTVSSERPKLYSSDKTLLERVL